MSREPREVKIVVLGASNTGRRALIRKYVHSAFSERYEPFDNASAHKQITVDGEPCLVELFFADLKSYSSIELGDAFILLYAVNDRGSFIGVRDLHQLLQQTRAKSARNQSSAPIPVYLVGSKIDLESERQVSLEEAKNLAIQLRCRKLFEISSKNHREEIDDLFTKLVRELPRSQNRYQQQSVSPSSPQRQQQQQQQQPQPQQRSQQSVASSTTTSAYMAQQQATRPETRSGRAPPPSSFPSSFSPSPNASPRKSSMLDRFKFGSLRRTPSMQSITRKKSDSFGESMKQTNSSSYSRDNARSASTPRIMNGNVGNSAGIRTNSSPFRLDVDTSAWRETVQWPSEISPEDELRLK